jgi:2-methylcitrate dehydratase PrpD
MQSDPLVLLGRAAAGLKLDNLPPEVVMRAKQRVLDTVGCLIGSYQAGIAEQIREFVLSQGGAPEATLLPGGQKTTVSLACLAHATYMHGMELTDAAPRGTVHPGNEIVPAALAGAEKRKLGGAAVIAAVAAGYEVEIRIGRALFPSAFYRGWWTPGLFGGIGSAVTMAHLLGVDAKGMDNTIGIALNLLPTASAKANEEGETIKWLIGGQSSSAGILAAEMASRGVKGMRDVVKGWLPVIADKVLPERLTEGVREDGGFDQWEILSGVLTKHYATVGPLTASLDATFDLVEKNKIAADDIKEIHVDAMRRTAIFNTVHPGNEVAARASLPYCLAVAVCRKDPALLLGPAFHDDVLKDKAVWAAADKVRITENEDYEQRYPAQSLARVTITLKNGKSFSQEEDRSARGRYLTPTDEDIARKFRLIAVPVLGKARAEKVIELAGRLESMRDIGELVQALKP